jgi:hypothetical protein
LGKPLGTIEAGIKALFRKRTTEKERIAIARGYLRGHTTPAGEWMWTLEAFSALDWCRITRNTFAHATWAVSDEPCLFYANLAETARSTLIKPRLTLVALDAQTLERIEAYFLYTERCLRALEHNVSGFRSLV